MTFFETETRKPLRDSPGATSSTDGRDPRGGTKEGSGGDWITMEEHKPMEQGVESSYHQRSKPTALDGGRGTDHAGRSAGSFIIAYPGAPHPQGAGVLTPYGTPLSQTGGYSTSAANQQGGLLLDPTRPSGTTRADGSPVDPTCTRMLGGHKATAEGAVVGGAGAFASKSPPAGGAETNSRVTAYEGEMLRFAQTQVHQLVELFEQDEGLVQKMKQTAETYLQELKLMNETPSLSDADNLMTSTSAVNTALSGGGTSGGAASATRSPGPGAPGRGPGSSPAPASADAFDSAKSAKNSSNDVVSARENSYEALGQSSVDMEVEQREISRAVTLNRTTLDDSEDTASSSFHPAARAASPQKSPPGPDAKLGAHLEVLTNASPKAANSPMIGAPSGTSRGSEDGLIIPAVSNVVSMSSTGSIFTLANSAEQQQVSASLVSAPNNLTSGGSTREDRRVSSGGASDPAADYVLHGYVLYALWCISRDDVRAIENISRARFFSLEDVKLLRHAAESQASPQCSEHFNAMANTLGAAIRLRKNPIPQPPPAHLSADPSVVRDLVMLDRFVVIMVGLPARGKTYLCRRLARYLNFFHNVQTKIFNVGDYRRVMCGNHLAPTFFDHKKTENLRKREAACEAAMLDLVHWMCQDGGARIAFFDATNSSRERRQWVMDQVRRHISAVKLMFVESVVTDDAIVDANIRAVKLGSPDFHNVEETIAVREFRERIKYYEEVYSSVDESNKTEEGRAMWVKVVNLHRYVVNNIKGFIPNQMVQFLMHLNIDQTRERVFYLSRHGQSEYNALGKIGGDSGLSVLGEQYAKVLGEFAATKIAADCESGKPRPSRLWTSTLKRTKATAAYIPNAVLKHPRSGSLWHQFKRKEWRALDELYAGQFDGLTYPEIEASFPTEFAERQRNKLTYRYPRGESYLDVIQRVHACILDMERCRERLLIIGHQGVLRILYAYWKGLTREEAPTVSIPLNTVIELTPETYGCQEKRIQLLAKVMSAGSNGGQGNKGLLMPLGSLTSSSTAAEGGAAAASLAAAAGLTSSTLGGAAFIAAHPGGIVVEQNSTTPTPSSQGGRSKGSLSAPSSPAGLLVPGLPEEIADSSTPKMQSAVESVILDPLLGGKTFEELMDPPSH